MIGASSPRYKKWGERIRRMVIDYRTPVFAMILFSAFSIALTGATCVLRTITGIPCPGCGLTRATLALIRFDWPEAFRFHPMVFLLWPFLLCFAILLLLKKTTVRKFTPYLVVFGICLVLVYLVRMILFFPNVEPMVYDYHSVFGRILLFVRQWV